MSHWGSSAVPSLTASNLTLLITLNLQTILRLWP